MTIGITIITLAFVWLLYETRFLTVRLPYGKPFTGDVIIQELLPIIVAASIIIAATMKGFGIKTKRKDKAGLLGRLKYLIEYVLINRLIRGENGK